MKEQAFEKIYSNLFLQWCQNDLSVDLALKFAFSWHTEKFFLACLVLLIILIFLIALAGSVPLGSLTYVVAIGVLGFANYMKMSYRQEPHYAVYSDLSCRRNRDRIVLLVHVSKPEKRKAIPIDPINDTACGNWTARVYQ